MTLVADESVDSQVVAALTRIVDVYDITTLNRGVVLTRLSGMLPEEKANLVADVFRDYMSELPEAFVVISTRGVRIRRRIQELFVSRLSRSPCRSVISHAEPLNLHYQRRRRQNATPFNRPESPAGLFGNQIDHYD